MAQQTILGSDTVKDALKTKVNANDTELYTVKTEVEAARDGELSLLAKQQAQDSAIAALAAGSGVVISPNDTTTGFLNGKLIAGEGVDFTENNDGGDETLTISGEDASTTNKGIVELATTAETDAGTATDKAVTPASIAGVLTDISSNTTDISRLENNLILEVFRRMIGDSQVGADAFQDGWVDTLQDESNVDTGASSGQVYNSKDDYYSNMAIIDSYDTSNYSFVQYLYAGSVTQCGQCFTVSAESIISSCMFYLNTIGSPTGNVVAKIYQLTGTIGTNGKPDGVLLATSEPIDAATLPADFTEHHFSFGTPPTLSADDYCIGVEYTGGSSSHKVGVGLDNTSPTHAGNQWTYTSPTYSAYSGVDTLFTVYTPTDMSLISDAYEAESEPTKSKALFIMEDIVPVTINTDVKAWASNDDGSTYEQITLVDEGDWETSQKIIVGSDEMTAVSDKTTRLKITTHNNKEIKIHAVANMLKL